MTGIRSTISVAALPAFFALQSCASVPPAEPVSADSLRLDLRVEQVQVAGSSHPLVRLKVENAAARPIAFSRTFGITNQPWLSFEIQTLGGEGVFYPSEIDVFGETPAYKCLQPGERIEWQIDLLSWRPTFGGEVSEEEYAFDLPPGRYRIRARYSDDPGRVRARCRGIKGTSSSEWVGFEVND